MDYEIYLVKGEELKEDFEKNKEIFFGSFYKTYEKLCKKSYEILKVSVDKKKKEKMEAIIKEVFLNLKAEEIESFSILSIILFSIIGVFFLLIIQNILILFFFMILGLISYTLIQYYPSYLKAKLSIKKKGQLLLLLLFLSMKLRENPNLENAIRFSIKHLPFPIKLDLIDLMNDIINKKYLNAKDALDFYAKKWENEAYFFTIGVQLLITSLFETDPIKRDLYIDKALEEAISSFMDDLSAFVRELQTPISIIATFGITLPTLLLTVFPIAALLLSEMLTPSFLFFIFDIIIPLIVFLSIKQFVEAKRTEISYREDKYLQIYFKEHDIKNKLLSIIAGIIFGIILFFVIVFIILGIFKDYTMLSIAISSMFIFVLGTSISFIFFYYYNFYSELDKNLDEVSKDVSSFLFSLGNLLNDGYPMEISIVKIYSRFKNKRIGKFLVRIYKNLKAGFSLEQAIFDQKYGALKEYPSAYLEASMELLSESSKVSPQTAGKVAIIVSKYFTYLERVKQRFLDLTAETIGQLKSLLKLLTPMILAIVVSVSLMTLNILYKLGLSVKELKQAFSGQSFSDIASAVPLEILDILFFKADITPSAIILIVGIFNIEITILTAYMITLIENGDDKLKLTKNIYKYLFLSSLIYSVFTLLGGIGLWGLADALLRYNFI